MIVVSPWSTGGYVCSETFDHTSILRFMEKRFGVKETNISPWRRAICGDLTSAFDFSLKITDPADLPDTAGYAPPDRDRHNSYVPKPPAQGTLPRQEAGARPSRPLSYAPYVDGAADLTTGKYKLTFSAGDQAGAAFQVRSQKRTDGPWTYTAAAGKPVSDSWNSLYSAGSYDLTAHGPNGFLRTFQGNNKAAEPEVKARHNAGNLKLTLTNPSTTDAHVTVTNAYGGERHTYTVRAGATVEQSIDLRATQRWYDLTVVVEGNTGYLRRLAGHVENGKAGSSDPGIATV